MKKFFIEKTYYIFSIFMACFNIYKIFDNWRWITNSTAWTWKGGLGIAKFNYIFGLLAIIIQIINIILAIYVLKNKKYDKFYMFLISLTLIIITIFIPIYGFPILYPYNNLYGVPLFK